MSRRIAIGVLALSAVACSAAAGEEPMADQTAVEPGEPVDLGGDPTQPRRESSAPAGGEGNVTVPERRAPRADRFATKVVSFTPGPCAGFGQAEMPAVVLGPPQGRGTAEGSLDVVSLGKGGEIVLSFEPNAIVDGPGADLLVFENAFYPSGDATRPYAEAAEVSVSDDGVTWTTFPCAGASPPYATCAGWHPVLADTADDAIDPARAGGDPFDLAEIGVARARFVRIKDRAAQRCTSQSPNTNGFDLDAIAAVHAEDP